MDQLVSSQQLSEHALQVLSKTKKILSGKWRLQVIFQLARQTLRYGDLRRTLPEISEKILISELNKLVALGFLQKESFREIPPRVEYSLTEKAHSVMPILYRLTHVMETFLL